MTICRRADQRWTAKSPACPQPGLPTVRSTAFAVRPNKHPVRFHRAPMTRFAGTQMESIMQNDDGDRRGEPGPLREYAVVKRSVVVGGHKTSVSLEDAFWTSLKDIATRRGITLSTQIASIDTCHDQQFVLGDPSICPRAFSHASDKHRVHRRTSGAVNAACSAWPEIAPVFSAPSKSEGTPGLDREHFFSS